MKLDRTKILTLSSLVEGGLTVAFCLWALTQDLTYSWFPSGDDLLYAVLFCLPLIAFNYVLFGPLADRLKMLSGCSEFKDTIVKPIADELDPVSAFCTAMAAGIGEELFFRGLIQTEFGIWVASLLFAVLHFGPAIRSYYFIASIYFFFGLYFGYMRDFTGSLWAPILTHGLYDFVALLYMKYVYQKKSS